MMKNKLAVKLKALTDLHDALMQHHDDNESEPYSEYMGNLQGTGETSESDEQDDSDSMFKKLKKAKKH